MDPNTLSDTANIVHPINVILTGINALSTIFIGIFVAWIASREYRLSRAKFKLDLFEKRYTVYKATQRFLTLIFQKVKIDLKELCEFRGDTQDAVFLFDNDIPEYLDAIDKKALKMWEIEERCKGIPKGDERSKLAREKTLLFDELIKKLPELKEAFGKYMKFKKWK